MVELTVGYVAGLIAFTVAVVQLWSPNTLVFIIAGLLRDKNTAATWGVAGRAIQNSLWPEFLQTDTSLTRGVRGDVNILVKSIHVMRTLIAIAGIITPLGLYSAVAPASRVVPTFYYAEDLSPFGISTPPRSNLSLARTCSSGHGAFTQGPAACPYTNDLVIETGFGNGTVSFDFPHDLTTDVPDILREIYGSGTAGLRTTVSNYFDIEYRLYSTVTSKYRNNGSAFLVGAFRQMDSVILNDNVQPVEGLIVDTKHGGVGLRNHTLPADIGRGATWEEDLLFIEPYTVCADTNLTLDFSVSADISGDFAQNISLVDHGGFANLNKTYPYYDRDNSQQDPDLKGRAYKAAWMNNAWTMLYLNVTNPNNETSGLKSFSYLNSTVGKEFPLEYSSLMQYDALGISSNFGNYLNLLGGDGGDYPNPFNMDSGNFSDISMICSGAGSGDIANISNILVNCGLMRGAARRHDGGSELYFESGSRWSSPLYACASSVRATIKTVSFLLNGTEGLKDLSVTDVRPKVYPNNDSIPLWGVEETGKSMDEISPIWGLVSPAYENYPNISVIKAESLHLPGYSDSSDVTSKRTYQNMPGSDFFKAVSKYAYDISDNSDTYGPRVDYTGYANMALYVKWQNLSSSPETAPKIVDLIWTDSAAAVVVGTKGVLGAGNVGSPSEAARVSVRPMTNQIKYRWLFGIPALIVVLICMVIGSLAFCTLIFRRHNLTIMRRHLNQSSAGRLLTGFLYPEYCNLDTNSRVWSQTVGQNVVDLGGDNALMSLLARNNFSKGGTVVQETPIAGEGDGFLVPRTPSPYNGHTLSPQFPPPPQQFPPHIHQG